MANELVDQLAAQTGAPNMGASGYAGTGAAYFYGLQNELMRKAAIAEAQRQQIAAEARQQAIDAENTRVNEAKIAAETENAASSKMTREALATKNTQEANDKLLASLPMGDVSPETAAKLKTIAPDQVKSTPVLRVVQPGVLPSTQFSDAGVQSMPAGKDVTEPTGETKNENLGTQGQRDAKSRKDFMQATYDHLKQKLDDGDELTGPEQYLYLQANSELATGKAANPGAGVINGPTEKHQTLEERMTDIGSRQILAKQGKGPMPNATEMAQLQDWTNRHPDEATKFAESMQRLASTIAAAGGRQQAQFLNASAEEAAKEYEKKFQDLRLPGLEKLATTLSSPGGVNDVLAAPELLSAMAGGQGNGLRMSQAELNMIQQSRPLLDSLIIKGGNLIGINNTPSGYAALTAAQRDQMRALLKEVATNNARLGQIYNDVQIKLGNAKTAAEVRQIKQQAQQSELGVFGEKMGIPITGSKAKKTADDYLKEAGIQ